MKVNGAVDNHPCCFFQSQGILQQVWGPLFKRIIKFGQTEEKEKELCTKGVKSNELPLHKDYFFHSSQQSAQV